MKSVFDRTELRGLKLKNRLFRSATWEASARADGSLPEELIGRYEELAAGGVAAVITGFTGVSDEDRALAGMMRLSRDELIGDYARLAERIKKYDCRVLAQIALEDFYGAGNRSRPRPLTIDELDEADIQAVVDLFVQAARRAAEAGFDGVQLHVAHNFFLSRFISPGFNHRRDGYGRSPEGRARIALEILRTIDRKAGSFHVGLKINCSDFFDGGLDFQESLEICRLLAGQRLDSIEVSGNGTSRSAIKALQNEAYFLDFASQLQKTVETPVILVGGLRSLETMGRILNDSPAGGQGRSFLAGISRLIPGTSGKRKAGARSVEYFSLSRPLIREPQLPKRWLSDKRPADCISCNRCYQTPDKSCVFIWRPPAGFSAGDQKSPMK